jgi:leader peptidase (prepilin peptidase)/N-methyltransferase
MIWIRLIPTFYLGLVGLAIGSFLNVVVWRLPRGKSLVSPPSACPACSHRLHIQDLVPVVSWLALKGHCRYCGAPIAARYPLVEAFTGLAFVLLYEGYGLSLQLLPALGTAIVLIPAALILHDSSAAAPKGSRKQRVHRGLAALTGIGLILLLAGPWICRMPGA